MYNTVARSWFDKLTTNGFALLKGYNKKKNALKLNGWITVLHIKYNSPCAVKHRGCFLLQG
jgi:hypothetical protein